MRNLNISTLIQNIKELMNKEGLTQQQLADKIEMSQPNFNRAIKNKNGQCFTLQQICNIANYFNVSVDSLLGFEKEPSTLSEKKICSLFTSLLEKRKLVTVETSRIEEVHTPIYDDVGFEDCRVTKEEQHYHAFIFPKHVDVGPLDRFTEEEIDMMKAESYCNGNHDESNNRINAFFQKYFKLYGMFLKNEIDESLFHEIVEKFYDDLE